VADAASDLGLEKLDLAGVELFDTHAHLNSDEFSTTLSSVLERAYGAGVRQALVVGTTLASSRLAVELAAAHAGLFAAAGIHPNYCAEVVAGDWLEVERLFALPKVVAVGETGLDRYWDMVPFDTQQDYFDRHLRLAQRLDLPIVIHMRDCEADILAMLREATRRGPLRGIMHSFAGSAATAEECLGMGLHLSFAGMVTYKKMDELRRVAAAVPADRILVETDSPYLPPHPFRGRRPNEPAMVVHTAACVAAARGQSLFEFARMTTDNARRLFRVENAP
jgi:TatD DNase family protein